MSSCPTHQELLLLFVGSETEESRCLEIERHLVECLDCQKRLEIIERNYRQKLPPIRNRTDKDTDIDFPEAGGQDDTPIVSVEPSAVELFLLPERIGTYRIDHLLGQGGWGAIYKAYDEELKRNVAIKFILRNRFADKAHQERFEREKVLLGQFDHPNIVRVYSAGQIDGLSFIVTEYLHGCDLQQYL